MPKLFPAFVTSRLLALCLLLVLVTGGVLGWYSRHQWLPALANHWLEDIEVGQVEELRFADSGKSITLKRLVIALANGRQLELQDLKLTNWTALLASPEPDSGNFGANLLVDQAILTTPDTLPAQPGDANQTASQKKASSRETEGADLPDQTDDPEPPLLLSQTLQQLHTLALNKIDIRALRWPELAAGAFTLSIAKRGDNIEGQFGHSACMSCSLSVALAGTPNQVQLQMEATEGSEQAFTAKIQLDQPETIRPQVSRFWSAKGKVQVALESTEKLARKIGLKQVQDLPESSATGRINLQFKGEVPDTVLLLEHYRKLAVNLDAETLQWAFSPGSDFFAAPLKITANNKQPLALELASVTPLRFASAAGELFVTVDTVTQATDEKWVQAKIILGDTGQQDISLSGVINLNRSNQVLSPGSMRALLEGYLLTDIAGELSLSGNAKLPPLANISNLEDLILTDIQLQLQPASNLSTRLSPSTTESPLASIGWPDAAIQLTLNETATLTADHWPAPVELELKNLSVHGKPSQGPVPSDDAKPEMKGTIKQLKCTDVLNAQCSLQFASSISSLDIKEAEVTAQDITFEAEVSNLSKQVTSQTGVQNFQLSAFNASAATLKVGEASFEKPELFSPALTCSRDTASVQCSADEVALSLAPLTVPDTSIEGAIFFEEVSVKNEAQGIHATANYRSDSLTIRALNQFRATLAATGTITLEDNQIGGDSQVSASGINIETSWKYDLENTFGELTFTVPEATFNPQSPLSRSIQGLPVDIVDGTLTASGRIYWPEGKHKAGKVSRINTTLESVGISFDDIFAVGVDSSISLTQSRKNWITAKSQPVSIQKLDAGLPVENLRFKLGIAENGDLTLADFSGELLNGALTSKVLTWNLDGAERDSLVSFTGLSLEALAKEMEAENFVATGLLDATMPITTDSQGVTIENGTLTARPPGGRLRYYGAFSPSMLTSNPQLKLIAGALEDYNYRDMRGTITYPLSGDLKLNLKLTGRSSAVDANRDLIINLNLENNVPSMLKSLQASRDLTDVLEKSVQ